jgi:carbon monoxide dehydrogenase subunit G
MKVQLEKSYDMPGPASAAWTVLGDIERVAGCMPGARITERVDDKHYKGTVAVKFGPANMSFRGEVEVASYDAAAQTVRLVGKGTDTTGGSGASMDITARIEAVDGASSRLVGTSEVSMSGKAAAFGNRLAGSVAEQVLRQFAANFAAQVQAVVAQAPAEPETLEAPSSTTGVGAGADADAAGSQTAHTTAAPAAPRPAPVPIAPPSAPAPLNGLALAWAVLKDWLRSLFAPRKA